MRPSYDDAPEADYRCIRCVTNLAVVDPEQGVLALCETCLRAETGQAPVADDGAPSAAMPEAPTARVRTLTDAELLAEMELHAEAGQ